MRYRLRAKLALCAIALVLLVDLLVSAPLFFIIIRARQETLLKALFVISAAALALGVSGALAMSSLLLRSIRKLVRYVELIRDTENRASLVNLEINISGKDEVAVLGKTINEMTQELARAAASVSDLNIGKEIQKKFIPLDVDKDGNKLNSGYKGRFAAFTLCLFDSQTGDLRFCNAGDNIIHIYDASEKGVKSITLPQTPAAGALPNSVVEAISGYRAQTLSLDHGDILLLYTDGIEEAKRYFRDASYNEITCCDGEDGMPHGSHLAGQGSEAMGAARVHGIVNAVMNRAIYRMNKWHNPEGDKDLCFDYSGCNGGVEEVIMALIAAEKMFRCYHDPGTTADDEVLIEKKADAFLRAHFSQYSEYCSHTRECHENSSYIYYDYLKEDEQYDDLAILGIKRK